MYTVFCKFHRLRISSSFCFFIYPNNLRSFESIWMIRSWSCIAFFRPLMLSTMAAFCPRSSGRLSLRPLKVGNGEDMMPFKGRWNFKGKVGAADYIAVVENYHTVFISGIPVMSMRIDDKARRFITLVDELYNHHCCLFCSAASSIDDLFQGTEEGAPFDLEKEPGALCAMKEVELFLDDTKAAECIKQLQQEINVLSHLKHPNIVQYYGSEIERPHTPMELERRLDSSLMVLVFLNILVSICSHNLHPDLN